jgi:hypothetical protein
MLKQYIFYYPLSYRTQECINHLKTSLNSILPALVAAFKQQQVPGMYQRQGTAVWKEL